MKEKIKSIILFITNPRLLLCFLIAWFITNGWSYVLLGVGTYYKIDWMIAISASYLAFLWLPISPEKIVTFAIAILLLRWLFPNDKKSLGVLRDFNSRAKNYFKSKINNIKSKRKTKNKKNKS